VTGFAEVVVIAFVTQLAVLPGEKVQFIIAGLSTRFHPLVVVSAAGSAFAIWTVAEIAFGKAVQRALPPLALALITAGLFVLFAVLLVRSAPAPDAAGATPDGGVVGEEVLDRELPVVGVELPERFGSFLPIFGMMMAGEFGDKTQLVTIGLAVQFGATPAIWVGEMLAIIPVSLANAYFFNRVVGSIDVRKAHYASAVLFGFFGADTLLAVATGFSVWERTVGAVAGAVGDALLGGFPTVVALL